MSNLDPTGCDALLLAIIRKAERDARGRDPATRAEARAFLAELRDDWQGPTRRCVRNTHPRQFRRKAVLA